MIVHSGPAETKPRQSSDQGNRGAFLTYYFGVFRGASRQFGLLRHDSRKLRFGFIAVMIQAILYTLVYVFLTIGDGRPYKPWLRIPEENYYAYNIYFLAPSMLLAWLLSAAVVHVLVRALGRRGEFDSLLASFGFVVGIVPFTTGIHDLVTSFLGAAGVINQQGYEQQLNGPTFWRALLLIQMAAYVLCFLVLFTKAVRAVYHTRVLLSVILGLSALLIFQGFFFIFNR
jgi:hypothetical protein